MVDAKGYADTTPTLTAATALAIKGRIADYVGDLVLFDEEETETVSVYSIAEDKVVFTATDSRVSSAGKTEYVGYSVDLMMTDGFAWFSVIKTVHTTDAQTLDNILTDREVSIYDAKGSVVLSGKDMTLSFDTAADLVFFKDKIYRVAEGTFTEIWTTNGLAALPTINSKAGKGYVGGSENAISLYSEKMELVASFIIPSYAENDQYFVTENGNVIVQYLVACEEDAKDYDFFMEGAKYNVETVLLNKKNSDGKKLDVNYILRALSFGEDLQQEGLNASLGNLALGYIIEDRRVNEDMAEIFTLSNGGKITGYLDGFVPGTVRDLTMVAENRWIVLNLQGNRYLLDKKGKNLGELGNYQDYSELGILSENNKLYGWNLELLADFNEQGVVSSCALLEKGAIVKMRNGDVLYYTGGTTTTIARNGEGKTVRRLSDRLYVVEVERNGSTIYNDLGQQLYTVPYGTTVLNTYVTGESGVIVQLNSFEKGESCLVLK